MQIQHGQGHAPHNCELLATFQQGENQTIVAAPARSGDKPAGKFGVTKPWRVSNFTNAGLPLKYDLDRFKHRSLIEQFFGTIKHFHWMLTR